MILEKEDDRAGKGRLLYNDHFRSMGNHCTERRGIKLFRAVCGGAEKTNRILYTLITVLERR